MESKGPDRYRRGLYIHFQRTTPYPQLMTFDAPDFVRFPALRLAYDALRTGRGATTVYNAANEVAVAAFIGGKIRFGAIARLVEATMNEWIRSGNLAPLTSADDAIAVDHNARNKAATLLPQIAAKAS